VSADGGCIHVSDSGERRFFTCTASHFLNSKIWICNLIEGDNLHVDSRDIRGCTQCLNGNRSRLNGETLLTSLFCLVLFIAFHSAFAAQIEAVIVTDKPTNTKSSASGRAWRQPWKTNIVTTSFGSVNHHTEIISSQITPARGTSNG
jgi:hypothetical protein